MEATKAKKKTATKAARPAARRGRPRSMAKEKPLPPPVEPEASASAAAGVMENAIQEPAGDLFGLGAVFGSQSPTNPAPQPDAVDGSSTSSTAKLSDEAERILQSVPEAITEEGDNGAVPNEGGQIDEPSADPMGAMLAGVEFSEPLVRDLVMMVTASVASWRKRDCYKLDEERAGMLAGPYARLLNGWWARFAPQLLTSMCAANPGLMEAAMMTAVVFAPMVAEDMRQTRKEREQARRVTRPSEAHGTPSTQSNARPAAGPKASQGVIWDQGEAA